jgi:hypothetical protein
MIKKQMKPMLASATNPNHFLAIDSGKITGHVSVN